MTDLLSSLDKQNIHAMFDHIHDTFARNITIYISQDSALVDTDGNHNPMYGDKNPEKPVTNFVPYVKKARIRYGGSQDRGGPPGADSQLNVSFPKGMIRLKVDSEAYQLLTKAKKITVDDRLCELVGAPARPGPFSPNYWTIELKQVD